MNNIFRTALTLAMLVLAGCAAPVPRPTAESQIKRAGARLAQLLNAALSAR